MLLDGSPYILQSLERNGRLSTRKFYLATNAGTLITGSEHNDEFYMDESGDIRTRTNRSGG